MKLREAIAQVDRSESNTFEADPAPIADRLGLLLSWDDRFGKRMKKHWLYTWLCTDTWVGFAVYYMDEAPVAVSFQSARKNHEEIDFLSAEAAQKVRQFIQDLLSDQEVVPVCSEDFLDEEIGETFTVTYSSQLLTKKGFYQGKPATVVKVYDKMLECDFWQTVDLEVEGEGLKQVSMSEFDIPFRLTKVTR